MNVRFKKTERGEVAILPRKEFEALAAKAAEADEDFGTARLVARARKEIAAGAPLIPKVIIDRIAKGGKPLRVLREWRDVTQLYLFQDRPWTRLHFRSGKRPQKRHDGRTEDDCRCAQCAA